MVTPARPNGAGSLAVPGAVVFVAGLAITAAALATWALAVVVAVLQLALAWAWSRTLRASPGTTVLIAGWALLGDLSLSLTHGHPYHAIVGVGGTGVAAVILYQLGLRRAVTLRAPSAPAPSAPAPPVPAAAGVPSSARVSAELVTGLSGIVLGLLLTGYLALRAGHSGDQPADMVVIAGLLGVAVVVAVGRLGGWAGLPPPVAGPIGALVAGAAGAGFGALNPSGLSTVAGLAAAAAGAVTAGLVDLVLIRSRDGRSVGAVHPGGVIQVEGAAGTSRPSGTVVTGALLGAVVPLACAAPLVYLVGRHLPG